GILRMSTEQFTKFPDRQRRTVERCLCHSHSPPVGLAFEFLGQNQANYQVSHGPDHVDQV
ncbi:MAG TPA: hypothetical protein VM842_08575, partial [Nitrospira sp.]|nr:hypothetical protein [Nitrospira sp.]